MLWSLTFSNALFQGLKVRVVIYQLRQAIPNYWKDTSLAVI